MIRIIIYEKGNSVIFKQFFSSGKHFAEVFTNMLDMIIINELLKASPEDINLSAKQQEEIVLKKRFEMIEIMKNQEVDLSCYNCPIFNLKNQQNSQSH